MRELVGLVHNGKTLTLIDVDLNFGFGTGRVPSHSDEYHVPMCQINVSVEFCFVCALWCLSKLHITNDIIPTLIPMKRQVP